MCARSQEFWMHYEASALQVRSRSFAGQMAAPPSKEKEVSSELIHALEVCE